MLVTQYVTSHAESRIDLIKCSVAPSWRSNLLCVAAHLIRSSVHLNQNGDEQMATIQKRKNKDGSTSYKVTIKLGDGLPPQYKSLPTFQEAKDWAAQEEAKRRQGLYFPDKCKQKHTLTELIDRYIQDILPSLKSAEDVLRHLNWWKSKLGKYTLNHISSDLISKQRTALLEEVLPKGNKRSTATVNRYLASLSAVLSHGVKECDWIATNPARRVKKLKEPPGRDRVLSPEECSRLLDACANSSNELLC